jgi:hypothetical protein
LAGAQNRAGGQNQESAHGRQPAAGSPSRTQISSRLRYFSS